MRATYTNIYLSNIKNNIQEIKKISPSKTKICIPVKADAYGHGAVNVSKIAMECGVDYLAVATVPEAIELRQADINLPIIVLSVPNPSEINEIFSFNLIPVVQDEEFLNLLGVFALEKNQNISIQLKIDTGMGRIGCLPEDVLNLVKKINSSKCIKLDGMFTHLPVPDSILSEDIEYTKKQIQLFNDIVLQVKEAGFNPGICHMASSGGVLNYPEATFDMVRPGLAIYGYYPGDINFEYLQKQDINVSLLPAMELCSKIVAIRNIKKGQSVSYGRTWVAPYDCEIGVLPIGYGDGLLRNYGKNLQVSINGKNYPICGRVCMDQCMVFLGKDSGVSRWDKAIIFGPKDKGAILDASDIACYAQTIPYEITCGINKRVPRVYIN